MGARDFGAGLAISDLLSNARWREARELARLTPNTPNSVPAKMSILLTVDSYKSSFEMIVFGL